MHKKTFKYNDDYFNFINTHHVQILSLDIISDKIKIIYKELK